MLGLEQVAHTANGFDGAVRELLAQVVDVHFDRVGAHRRIPVIEFFFELTAREHDARAIGQSDQKSIFLGGEQHRFAVVEHFAGFGLDKKLAALNCGLAAACGTAQQRADTRGELVKIKRLDQVVVGAGVQPFDTVGHGIAGRRHEHRRVNAARAHFLQYADAVFAGQTQIQNDKGKRSGTQSDQSGIAVLHPVDGIAFGFEPVDDAFDPANAFVWDERLYVVMNQPTDEMFMMPLKRRLPHYGVDTTRSSGSVSLWSCGVIPSKRNALEPVFASDDVLSGYCTSIIPNTSNGAPGLLFVNNSDARHGFGRTPKTFSDLKRTVIGRDLGNHIPIGVSVYDVESDAFDRVSIDGNVRWGIGSVAIFNEKTRPKAMEDAEFDNSGVQKVLF